nr:2,3-bisphosphoglycerate-independent phosphoglycerate mutase [Saprospiraceae bacterium]
PNTAHTTNPVPCVYLGKRVAQGSLKDGILADVAPTILYLMGLEKPPEMTGKNLFQ